MSDRKVHIKWIGPNDPMIRIVRNNARLYITKRELVELMEEIESFVQYYRDDFSDERIDVETLFHDGNFAFTRGDDGKDKA